MKKMTLTTLLLLSAVMVTPASANWFSRPDLGVQLNVGSAPNPTPNDLRALYSNYPGTRYSQADVLRSMTGKVVYGENGEELGYILAVDERARLASLQLPTGIAVTIQHRHADEPDDPRDRADAVSRRRDGDGPGADRSPIRPDGVRPYRPRCDSHRPASARPRQHPPWPCFLSVFVPEIKYLRSS